MRNRLSGAVFLIVFLQPGFLLGKRQADSETAALVRHAFCLGCSAVELDDLADHGKPQSQAGAGLAGRVCLLEPLPDPGQIFLRDSDAVILHIQTEGFRIPLQR